MSECVHNWKKWEKEQQWWGKDSYYQRRECKRCGWAEWRMMPIEADR